jgi:hypothetical protein
MDWPAAPGTLSILTYASSPLPVTKSIYQEIWHCHTLLLFSWSDRSSLCDAGSLMNWVNEADCINKQIST